MLLYWRRRRDIKRAKADALATERWLSGWGFVLLVAVAGLTLGCAPTVRVVVQPVTCPTPAPTWGYQLTDPITTPNPWIIHDGGGTYSFSCAVRPDLCEGLVPPSPTPEVVR